MVRKKLDSPLQRERREFERLFMSLDRAWNEDVEKEIIALVGGLQNKDRDVQVKQAKRLLFVLAKYDRREQMIVIARLLSFSTRRRLHHQLIKEGKIPATEGMADHYELTVLPNDLESALWPKKQIETTKGSPRDHGSFPLRTTASHTLNQEPLTPFGRDILRLKECVDGVRRRSVDVIVRIWNTLTS